MRLLTEPFEDVCEPATAGTVAAEHPLWAADLARAAGGVDDDEIFVCGPCSSCLDVAWKLIESGRLSPWQSVITTRQWAGRGQLRRSWVSEPGNLFAALSWPAEDKSWAMLTPLTAGYLIAGFLEMRGVGAKLKWPNDIMVESGRGLAKAGGILVEERAGRVLAGIGLNLVSAPDPELLRSDRAVAAARLVDHGIAEGPLFCWDGLVKFMRARYGGLKSDTGPAKAARLIESRLAWLGRRVSVSEGAGGAYVARITGLADDGGLRLVREGGFAVTLYSGQIAPLENEHSL